MNAEDFKMRTMIFAQRVLDVAEALPANSIVGRAIANQLCSSGASVGANYRAAARAKSTADFIHKMGIVEEEADESIYWMELIVQRKLLPASKLEALLAEGEEMLAMTVASIVTAERKR